MTLEKTKRGETPDFVKKFHDCESISLYLPKIVIAELKSRAEKNKLPVSREASWHLWEKLFPETVTVTKVSDSEVSA